MTNMYFDLSSLEYDVVKQAEAACGGSLVGRFGVKDNASWYQLLSLSDFDKDFVKYVALKADEVILRYVTPTTAAGGCYPLVKVNFERRLVYFLTQEAFDQGFTDFEPRGVKVPWIVIGDDRRSAA